LFHCFYIFSTSFPSYSCISYSSNPRNYTAATPFSLIKWDIGYFDCGT
jgi:hypothetical protein